MKKFILRAFIFFMLIAGFMTLVYLFKPRGQVGGHYERFASPKAYSLILGSSMAAQDIDPTVIDSLLQGTYQLPMYNYSFTINTSPYGETYTKSILRKLKLNTNKNSLFILAVDPFSIGNSLADTEGGLRREDRTFLGEMYCVHHHPNLEYLIRYSVFSKQFYKKSRGTAHISSSGRYVSNFQIDEDSSEVFKRIHNVILPDYYDNVLPNYHGSNERVASLINLACQLKEQGEVFLVRLPVGQEVSAIMDSIYPNFNQDMKRWAVENDVSYINFAADNLHYKTTDGVHLYSSEGTRLTYALCDSIKRLKNGK